jgi:P4 family phage/plasmid primase-like protien
LQPGDAKFDLSQDGLALDMGRKWQPVSRYVAKWESWMFYDGTRWQRDETRLHQTRTRDYLRRRADSLVKAAHQGEIENLKVEVAEAIAKSLRSAGMMKSVSGLATSNGELVATVDQWDQDPYLLGTPAGYIDLRTGKLQAATPDHYITKQTAVAPAAPATPCPIWTAFLDRIFRHDPELVPFVQRALGLSLIGEIIEHVLFFGWGRGGNGKGVLLNTTAMILGLGDYAAIAPADMLMSSQSDRHPCDMAMLRGARLVTAQEIAPGKAWDEPKLKSLTGGDPITARFMKENFFTYQPQFTLWCAGNHKPNFRTTDEAIRRRVLLVPFLQVIPASERDPELPRKLKAEWPAILRWMIDGCLAYLRDGLNPPASALAATADYLDAEDILGQWLSARCAVGPSEGWTPLASLFLDWQTWANLRGHNAGTDKALSKMLDERGLQRKKMNFGQVFVDIRLLPPVPPEVMAAAGRDASDDGDAKSIWLGVSRVRAGATAQEGTTSHASDFNGGDRHDRHNRHSGEANGHDLTCAKCHQPIEPGSGYTGLITGEHVHNSCLDARYHGSVP